MATPDIEYDDEDEYAGEYQRTKKERVEQLLNDRFFELTKRNEYSYNDAPSIADAIIGAGYDDGLSIRLHQGGVALWVAVDGVYLPLKQGKDLLRSLIARLLRKHATYKQALVNETINYLRDSVDVLPEPSPYWLIFRNKALNMATWVFEELDELADDDKSHIEINTYYDPEATCPVIDAVLARCLPADCIPLFWEAVGYSLTTNVDIKKAFLLQGPTDSGKSRVLEIIRRLVGKDNCSHISLQQLDPDHNRFAAASIDGKIINTYADVDDNSVFDTGTFKLITGTDPLPVEEKHERMYFIDPYVHLWFSSNGWPRSRDLNPAYFNRWIILPFNDTIPEQEQDPQLVQKATTRQEMSGALNHALEALWRISRPKKTGGWRGFSKSQSSLAARSEYRQELDPVGGWLAEWIDEDESSVAFRTEVHKKFVETTGSQMGDRSFFERARQVLGRRIRAEDQLGGRGPDRSKMVWKGVRLRSNPRRT